MAATYAGKNTNFSVTQLKEKLKTFGARTSGRKSELLERLVALFII